LTLWIGGHLSHSCREHRRKMPPALDSPPFCTGGEDTCDIRSRQPGNPEARHRSLNGPVPMVLNGKRFFLDYSGFAALDFLACDLMPVVPDLIEQLVDSGSDFR
jgi:hypothetical protein